MAKKDYDVVTEPEPAAPAPHILTLMDGTRPVWVRKSAVEAFHGLGDPVTSIRVLLRSGQSLIVAWTDEAKEALLDALVE